MLELSTQLSLLVTFCVLFILPSYSVSQESVCQIADGAIVRASEIRGLKIRKKVPCLVHGKKEVEGYLRHTIATKMPPDRLKYESLTYKLLGMIPDNFGYERGIVDLYLSQLGGYYDPSEKRFIMAGWLPAMFQTTIAVHELTHALQDQYFNLDKFIDMDAGSSDVLTARSALVEGDATAVMTDYARELSGQPPIRAEVNVESLMMSNLLGAALVSGLSTVPRSLQMMLLFPYTSGLRFVHTLIRKGGYAEIDKAFRNPPKSTEEILHPEKYRGDSQEFIEYTEDALRPTDVEVASNILYKDTLGEFGISALLSMYSQDSQRIASSAAGWAGDKVVTFGNKGETRAVMVWRTNWDTPKDADEFYTLFGEGLKNRFKVDIASEPGIPLKAVGDGLVARLSKSEKSVTYVIEKIGAR